MQQRQILRLQMYLSVSDYIAKNLKIAEATQKMQEQYFKLKCCVASLSEIRHLELSEEIREEENKNEKKIKICKSAADIDFLLYSANARAEGKEIIYKEEYFSDSYLNIRQKQTLIVKLNNTYTMGVANIRTLEKHGITLPLLEFFKKTVDLYDLPSPSEIAARKFKKSEQQKILKKNLRTSMLTIKELNKSVACLAKTNKTFAQGYKAIVAQHKNFEMQKENSIESTVTIYLKTQYYNLNYDKSVPYSF